MTRGIIALVSALFVLPIVVLCGFGMYFLWSQGWSFYAWFPIAGCFAAAYLISIWATKRKVAEIKLPNFADDLPKYWTARDRAAWAEVKKFVADAPPLKPDETANMERYAAEAQSLALRLTQLERPAATDAFGHLTLPELLTCAELVAQDLHTLTVTNIPGSHLVRIDDLRNARKAMDWYQTGRDAYWAVSAVVNPLKTALQFAANKIGLQSPFEQLRNHATQWFHVTYLHELGRYLIELNSGRLKVGAKRYRELLGEPAPLAKESSPDTRPLHVAILGQVNAGKSSLINALLGEAKAQVSVTPEISGATRYVYTQDGQPILILSDSAGYGLGGADDRERTQAFALSKQADIVIVVSHARSAARKADVDFLDAVKAEYAKQPGLIVPPVVVALSHIDLLTPAVEWSPPYHWETGERPKERSIREAVTATREAFGPRISNVVPVCLKPGQETGVTDHFVATLLGLIGEGRGVAIVRALEKEAQAGKLSKVGEQILSAGKTLYSLWRK